MFISRNKKGWELHTISNGKLSCENFNLGRDDVNRITEILKAKFERKLEEEHITISWDNWSGVFIMQSVGTHTDSANSQIKEIYKYLAEFEPSS